MNLIEQLGGYEKAKKSLWQEQEEGYAGDEIAKAMLQYRREHGIFEVGDKVVYRSLPHQRVFFVKVVLDGSIIIRECWGEAGAKCFSEFPPYADISHATDAEIEAGHRL